MRTRNTKVGSGGGSGGGSSKAFKFQRIPYLQRIIKVSANESGAYGAVRADAVPKAIDPSGPSIGDDLTHLLPHVRRWMEGRRGSFLLEQSENHVVSTDEDGETESTPVRADIKIARQLVQIVDTWKPSSSYPPLFGVAGSDCVLHAAGRDTPAHQVILATRSSVLRRLLAGDKMPSCRISVERTPEGLVRLHLPKSDHLTVLLLLQYLYSDDLPAVWDPRVGREIQDRSLSSRTVNLASVRSELRVLAETLELGALSSILQLSSKTSPTPLLMTDLSHTFEAAQAILHSPSPSASPLRPDVIIELADRTVGGHESILRSRSPFFSALFDESEWTRSRRDEAGNITVNLRHLRWSTMRPVFRYLYEDVGAELFDYHHQETVDQFLDFVFEVLAAANELLLDQLILICSSVVLRHVTTHNVCSLLSDASFYHAVDLKRSLQGYIARNMETMLESHLLDPMPNDTLDELATFVIGRQGERLPISRSGILVTSAMDRQRDWLAMEDFPKLSLKSTKPGAQASSKAERSPKLSPAASGLTALPLARPSPRRTSYSVPISPLASPAMHAQVSSEDVEDGLFSMDEEVGIVDRLANGLVGSLSLGERAVPLETPSRVPSSSSKPVWKSKAVEAERCVLSALPISVSVAYRSLFRPQNRPSLHHGGGVHLHSTPTAIFILLCNRASIGRASHSDLQAVSEGSQEGRTRSIVELIPHPCRHDPSILTPIHALAAPSVHSLPGATVAFPALAAHVCSVEHAWVSSTCSSEGLTPNQLVTGVGLSRGIQHGARDGKANSIDSGHALVHVRRQLAVKCVEERHRPSALGLVVLYASEEVFVSLDVAPRTLPSFPY